MVVYPRKTRTNAEITAYLTNAVPGLFGRPDPTMMMVLYDKIRPFSAGINVTQVTQGGNLVYVPVSPGDVPSVRTFRFFKKRPLTISYGAGNVVSRSPILYFVTDLAAPGGTSNSILSYSGYTQVSYKDI